MKEVSSHVLKISGKAELPQEIELGFNYHIALEGSVVSYTESDNEDNTLRRLYSFKPVKVDLLTPKGETLKLKDTRRNSQLIRSLLYKKWVNSAATISFEDTYDKFSRGIMRDMDELLARYE